MIGPGTVARTPIWKVTIRTRRTSNDLTLTSTGVGYTDRLSTALLVWKWLSLQVTWKRPGGPPTSNLYLGSEVPEPKGLVLRDCGMAKDIAEEIEG